MLLTQERTADSEPRVFDPIEWALRLGVALTFVGIGYEKVAPWPGSYWVKLFDEIGFGQWFRYATGTIQIIGGLLMFVPATALAGGALLACTMVGAILTHVFLLDTGIGGAVFPAAFLGLIVFAVRRRLTDRSPLKPLGLR
jgi:putative oxidoreductase